MAMAIPLAISRSGLIGAAVGVLVLSLGWSWRRRANVAIGAVAAVATSPPSRCPQLASTDADLFVDVGRQHEHRRPHPRLPRARRRAGRVARGSAAASVSTTSSTTRSSTTSTSPTIVDGGYLGLGVQLAAFIVADPARVAGRAASPERPGDRAPRAGRGGVAVRAHGDAGPSSTAPATASPRRSCSRSPASPARSGASSSATATAALDLAGLRRPPAGRTRGARRRPGGRLDAGAALGRDPAARRRRPCRSRVWPVPGVGGGARPRRGAACIERFLVDAAGRRPARRARRRGGVQRLHATAPPSWPAGTRSAWSSWTRRRSTGALNAGDALATHFPRFYVDADVQLTTRSLRDHGRVLASGPGPRRGPAAARPRPAGLPPRGAGLLPRVAAPAVLHAATWWAAASTASAGAATRRLGAVPRPIIADDLWFRNHFSPGERVSVPGGPVRAAPAAGPAQPPAGAHPPAPRQPRVPAALRRASHRRQRRALGATCAACLAPAPRWLGAPVYLAVNALAKRRARRRWRDGALHWDSGRQRPPAERHVRPGLERVGLVQRLRPRESRWAAGRGGGRSAHSTRGRGPTSLRLVHHVQLHARGAAAPAPRSTPRPASRPNVSIAHGERVAGGGPHPRQRPHPPLGRARARAASTSARTACWRRTSSSPPRTTGSRPAQRILDQPRREADVRIGDDCWLGTGVVVDRRRRDRRRLRGRRGRRGHPLAATRLGRGRGAGPGGGPARRAVAVGLGSLLAALVGAGIPAGAAGGGAPVRGPAPSSAGRRRPWASPPPRAGRGAARWHRPRAERRAGCPGGSVAAGRAHDVALARAYCAAVLDAVDGVAAEHQALDAGRPPGTRRRSSCP